MNRPSVRTLIFAIRTLMDVLRAMPLSGSVFFLLMLLPSSAIFGERPWDGSAEWVKGWFSWFDFLIGIVLLADLVRRRLVLSRRERIAFLLILMIYLWSWWTAEERLTISLCSAVFAHWLRLLFGYVTIKSIGSKVDPHSSLAYLNVIGVGICFSSIFVAILAYTTMPRLYGAGMTVASFGQLLATLIFINVCFRKWGAAVFFTVFLIFSLSRTSIVALIVLLFIYSILSGRTPKLKELIVAIFGIGVLAAGFIFFTKSFTCSPKGLITH